MLIRTGNAVVDPVVDPVLWGDSNKRRKYRRFPVSAGGFAALYPKLADHLTVLAAYGCQDFAAGTPPSSVLDGISTHHLVENQALAYRQSGDPLGRKAVGFDTSDVNEFAADTDTAFADLPSNAGRTLLLRFMSPDNATTARSLAGAGSSAAAARWGLLLANGGNLGVRASDGTTTVNATTVGTYDDSVVHDAALVWDRTAGTPALRVITASEIVSINLGALSAVDAATGFRIGACMGIAALSGSWISFAALLAGAMTQADMAVWRASL